MKEILLDELKQIQIDMLKEVHDFCVKNDIRYSLTYGTLIGAIRHNGYIPWDDDIDIFMTRPNYEEFKRKFSHSYICFGDIETDPKCNVPFGKIYDSRTELIEGVSVQWRIGVYIDVFVIDGLGTDFKKAKRHYDKFVILRKIRDFKVVPLSAARSVFKNIALLIGKLLLIGVSLQAIVKKTVKLKKTYNYEGSDFAADLCWGNSRRILPKQMFENYIYHTFENNQFMIVKDYDVYLRKVFGDYMQLPPEKKRVTHHDFRAYWK